MRFPLVEEQLAAHLFLLRNASGGGFHALQAADDQAPPAAPPAWCCTRSTRSSNTSSWLQQNTSELNSLYQDLLIHVTRFFREPETFITLIERIFPQIVLNRENNQPIRIWFPAARPARNLYSGSQSRCLKVLGEQAGNTPLQIFATDISDKRDRARPQRRLSREHHKRCVGERLAAVLR